MIPLAIGALALGAAGAAAAYKGISDRENIKPLEGPDRANYNYGGTSSYAYETLGRNAQNRAGVAVNGAQVERDRQLGVQSRDLQLGGYQRLEDLANGTGPQLGAMQAAQARDANIRAAMAMQASARGGLGVAIAQNAAQGQAMQANIAAANQGAQIDAQQRIAAMQAMPQYAAQIRAQDLQAQGMSAQQAQYQAALEMQQREANDRYAMGLYGLGNDSAKTQLSGNMAYDQQKAAIAAANQGQQYQNAAYWTNMGGQLLGQAASMGATAMTSGAGALPAGVPAGAVPPNPYDPRRK